MLELSLKIIFGDNCCGGMEKETCSVHNRVIAGAVPAAATAHDPHPRGGVSGARTQDGSNYHLAGFSALRIMTIPATEDGLMVLRSQFEKSATPTSPPRAQSPSGLKL